MSVLSEAQSPLECLLLVMVLVWHEVTTVITS
jgi:hypothetical protein